MFFNVPLLNWFVCVRVHVGAHIVIYSFFSLVAVFPIFCVSVEKHGKAWLRGCCFSHALI